MTLAGSANSTPQSENSASANDASLQIDSPVAALRKTWPDWDAAVSEAVTAFGSLSILVNNAGIVNFGRIDEYPHEDWARIIDVNLTGVFNGIKAAAPAVARAGATSIINVSSIAGLPDNPRRSRTWQPTSPRLSPALSS